MKRLVSHLDKHETSSINKAGRAQRRGMPDTPISQVTEIIYATKTLGVSNYSSFPPQVIMYMKT